MKRATEINDIIKSFFPEPLQEDSLEKFYYDGTMKSRIGDNDDISPIDDIFESCTTTAKSAYLLLGHRGCGKTTELNMLKMRLKKENYLIENINCFSEMDAVSPAVWDILILITEKLLKIAEKINCKISDQVLNSLRSFFSEEEVTKEFVEEASLDIEGGIEVESPSLLKSIINLYVKLMSKIRVGETTKKVIREIVKNRASQWISYVNQIADVIADRNGGKRPILIVEEVDKMNIDPVSEIFYKNAPTLSVMLSFHIIYTFPISLYYHPEFTSIRGYFSYTTLPMIKINQLDGTEYEEGMKTIRTIIEKRAELKLFAEGVIDLIIKKTGGSLRDLFEVIINAGKRARNRGNSTIEIDDVKRAFIKLKADLTSRIEYIDYEFLNIIKAGNKQEIKDRKKLLEMMQALVVLEYNGDRWHDVHPLVSDFLDTIRKT